MATRAFLASRDTGELSLQIDIRGYGMSADRAVRLPFDSVCSKRFHDFSSTPHFIRRKFRTRGCRNIVKNRKPTHFGFFANAKFPGVTLEAMTQQPTPTIQLINTAEFRENYANSVQVRVNLWDFFLLFGRINQTAPDNVSIHNFQGIYVSPQQAKALLNVLKQNVSQYETAFGEIKLEPQAGSSIVQ